MYVPIEGVGKMYVSADDSSMSPAALRTIIREELDGLRESVRESMRRVLHEEFPSDGANCRTHVLPGSPARHAFLPGRSSSKTELPPLSPNNGSSQPLDSLRHAADGGLALPGSVMDTAVSSQAGPENENATGEKRLGPTPETCNDCGNIFAWDAQFCRKCGNKRPVKEIGVNGVARSVSAASATAAAAVPGKKKSKKTKGAKQVALFKQKDEEDEELSYLKRITHHKHFELASGSLIVFNSMFLGWQTQYIAELFRDRSAAGEPIGEPPDFLMGFRIVFALLFTIELGVRWKAEGFIDFFKDAEVGWNILDVVVVSSSILELILDFVALVTEMHKSDALQNVSVFRVLRVVRVVRVARVIRVMKFFRELRMMIYSILGCVKNLMWVLVVLGMTFYVFGVGFTSATTDFLAGLGKEAWSDEKYVELLDYFGTVDKSILSLFMSMSGGNDWAQYYFALEHLTIWYRMGYLMFIIFCLFAVVNIVTGVFVESALQSNIKDRDILAHEELQNKKNFLQSMQSIFEEMDENGEGTISLAEFEEKLKDERVIAYFNALKLDVSDARILFALLDYDHSDEIGIDEFLDGIYKLQGESRNLDMKIMQYEVKFLKEYMDDVGQKLAEYFKTKSSQKAQYLQ